MGSPVRDGSFEFVFTGLECGLDRIEGESGLLVEKAQGHFCLLSIENIGDREQI